MERTHLIIFRNVLIAIGAAVLANALTFVLGGLSGATWQVGLPFPVGIAMVIGATVGPMLIGGLVARAAVTRWPKSRPFFAWGVFAFAVVAAPSGWMSSGDVPTGIALGAMHVIVGVAWLYAMKPAVTA